MIIALNFLYIVIGIGFLYFGGDLLVDNAMKIAKKYNLPSFLIGVVILGFGTSLPEFFVSFLASMTHNHDISLGNVLGSNITNIALILGLVSFILPVPVPLKTVAFDLIPLLISYVVLFLFLVNLQNLIPFVSLDKLLEDSEINRIEGFIMFAFMIAYLVLSYVRSQREGSNEVEEQSSGIDVAKVNVTLAFLMVLVSLGMLLIGSQVLILGAKYIAANVFHISDRIIGLTVIAVGTSLPELSASLISSLKGEDEASLGNIVGSNMFNILMILGVTSMFFPIATTETSFAKDYLMMACALFMLMIFGVIFRKIPRLGGAILLLGYISYTIYIIKN